MTHFDAKAFGQRVRERRKALGHSAEELASWAGYSPSYWDEIERGNVPNLSIERLFTLANLLMTSPAELLGDPAAALGRAVRAMIVPPVDWVCECIPDAVIEAGMKAMEAADEDRAKPYVAGESIDWDEGMYVAAIFRAMLGALVATQEGR